ncbi:minor capsid protein [Pantoea sp. QMID1]|nr:minor capsid protein [Pantoea sp. QMID1]
MSQQQKLNLGEFAQYEFTFNSKLLGQIVKASVRLAEPSAEMIAAAVLANPLELAMGKGRQVINITGALSQFGSKKTADILSKIAIGSSLGETQKQIVRRLTSLGVSHEEQVGSLVRTMTNHVAASAHSETMKSNDDILEGKKRVATLDGRTTPLCRSLDGKTVPLDAISPPFHWGCRTSEVPVLKAEYRREIPGSTRPAIGPNGVEQVSSKTTYGEWLARQPAAFQKEVLGPARYELFSKGDLSIDRFVDDNGKQYSLDQLRDLEPHAFELAGTG